MFPYPEQEKILPTLLGSTMCLDRKNRPGWYLLRAVAEEEKACMPTAHVAAGDSISKFLSQAPFPSLILSVKLQLSKLHY